MESPSIPDNRPHKAAFMAHTPEIVEPNDDTITKTHALSVRSDSPPWQAYEPSAFGQPVIGRPPTGSKINGESSRRYSMDQESIVDSIGNQSLGHHSIRGQPDRQWQYGQHQFDQRSLTNLSLDQQSVGNQSLGHHSIGGPPRGYYSSPTSPTRDVHSSFSTRSMRRNFVVNELPVLQQTNPNEGSEQFYPIVEENEEQSYNLVAPYEGDAAPLHSLERQADLMFCSEHMLAILNNPRYLARFREFLHQERPGSLSTLTYYLNACKSLKAIEYANALVRLAIDVPTAGVETAEQPVGPTVTTALEARVQAALDALTAEELPAFITSTCISITSRVVEERVRGTLPDKFQGTADALAEVFCLTDPSRPDNPIIFASGEFHRTTQYGMDYVLGRNCRFLQGPKTNPNSVRRIREGIKAERHHSELFLNYRRDGSPFMNLLQCAPLCDSRGKVRYFIGAQIDVSGLAMEGAQMESLQNIQAQKENPSTNGSTTKESKSEFQELGELFSPRELQNVREHGGNLFQPIVNEDPNHRLFLQDSDTETEGGTQDQPPSQSNPTPAPSPSLSLAGVYKHYLLVRPYPSLRILFTSPSLQIPGMLQSSFLNRIGDSGAKRDNILNAMMAGRSVTARIKWVTKFNDQGRNRWVHCTPLLANNGQIGVWMVVVIDDEDENSVRWTGNWPSNY
ncbi:PAS-associated [Penicillium canescens]|uniref:PAS-associated n=1 Tax=Penicillium canescens TaxID=5083 RepID=A0AAD6I0E8_PENCN|nr:PAS-associated [Penicillium canescens]KAJ6009860.1 PAS-associated [Penicillium canescens]KAJ6026645.1 PAS-associated [Penicillium canescens]KAJ6039926.1 PAS-associated [Penicillium canescens]KAJ6067716.1 PAS-associated [Penicillium canescens]